MKDLLLGQNSLIIENGDFKLVEGLELVKQQILVALYTLLGDWLLDDRVGIDIPRGVRNTEFLAHDMKKQIMGVININQIKKFELTQKGTNINVYAYITTEYGYIELNEDFNL